MSELTSDSSPPKVTVVVCAYKSGTGILPTLNSIVAQTFSDFELLVIDDASADETPQIIQSINDQRLRLVVNEENLGVVGSRNKSLDLARGEYIAHCDHDDQWAPSKLEKQVAYLDSHPDCGLVSTSIAKFQFDKQYSEGWSVSRSSNYIRWSLLLDSTFAHSAVMYRKATVREHGLRYYPQYTFADDWDFFLQISKVAEIASIPEPLTFYRLHDQNWSIRAADRMSDNGKKIFAKEINFWLANSVSKEDTDLYFDSIVTGKPCKSRAQLLTVGVLIQRMLDAFLEKWQPEPGDVQQISTCAGEYWWRLVNGSANHIGPWSLRYYWQSGTPHHFQVPATRLIERILKSTIRKLVKTLKTLFAR